MNACDWTVILESVCVTPVCNWTAVVMLFADINVVFHENNS